MTEFLFMKGYIKMHLTLFLRIAVLCFCMPWLVSPAIGQSFQSMTFTKDYFPGTNEINGRALGSTETMTIIKHKGKLFAGMGDWMDYPWETGTEGSQILRKDAYNTPWVVDTSFGYRSMRTEAVLSVTFTKDLNNTALNPAANILVCGAGDISIDRPREINIWVRDDNTGMWIKNTAFTVNRGSSGIRSFAMHTDNVTGKQWLFAGMVEGSVFKAQYNAGKSGWLVIDTTLELRGMGRVMAMTECNGDLYATAGVDLVGTDTVGGLFRRIDGINPSWVQIYRWKYNALDHGDEANIQRGITCVPDPVNPARNVIIGTRANPGVVEIIDPAQSNAVTIELDIRGFFSTQWNTPFRGPSLSAYNYFVPDTLNGQKIWWQSLWVEHPQYQTHPYNGSHFLVRYQDGTYKYGDIFDNSNPLPNGQRLRACRTICKSPFAQEPGAYYFGGYDCANDTSHNTSWIYKGVLSSTSTLNEFMKNGSLPNVIFSINYLSKSIYVNGLGNAAKSYSIMSVSGQVVQMGQTQGNRIGIASLNSGMYLIRLNTGKGNTIISKVHYCP